VALAPEALAAFEDHLEAWVTRCNDTSPTGLMARAHFGFGEPDRKRGKRLRPQILLLVAEQEGARRGDADGAAIAIELLHNYSLIHDDIEDGDELRHGRPTLWVRFGIPSAIVAGNAMCARHGPTARRAARAPSGDGTLFAARQFEDVRRPELRYRL
jgi:geranylgeranyl pyrophosphate synthase